MNPHIECIPCLVRQAYRITEILELSTKDQKTILDEVMTLLATNELNRSTPFFTHQIWNIIKNYTDNPDPYKVIKNYYNEKMQHEAIFIKDLVTESAKPFRTALKTAITGNIIDFGSRHDINEELIMQEISSINSRPLYIDNHNALKKQIQKSNNLLYLGDNCGEIVFDKIFIEQIKKLNPFLKVTFAVRGEPVINDITREDAFQVGMDKVAEIIDNGFDAPGTELDHSSDAFRELFFKSDLVISKGQGNYESLSEVNRNDIFFLFMVKCNAVAHQTKAEKGSLVCLHKK